MENRIGELIGFNSVNVFAISISITQIEGLLTILVLLSALIYNVKKIKGE